jgi:hypothetical protein
VLHVPDEGTGWSVTVTADRCDELGCLVWDLAVKHAAGPVSDLRGWADAVVGRVAGLVEPLRVVEVDVERSEAQLRSAKVVRRGDQQLYHEALLTGTGAATVRRFQAGRDGGRREQVAFPLTHEALARVAADLAGA